jgi:hypothetical protein
LYLIYFMYDFCLYLTSALWTSRNIRHVYDSKEHCLKCVVIINRVVVDLLIAYLLENIPFPFRWPTDQRIIIYYFIILSGSAAQRGLWPPRIARFLDHSHTTRHDTVGRTPPNRWSARRRDLYLTTHNTQNRHKQINTLNKEVIIVLFWDSYEWCVYSGEKIVRIRLMRV